MNKTGVLLVNLGTPDSPSVKDVRKYLFEFLNDPRVIDIPAFARFLLVNLIIVPFRAPKSAKIYKELWTNNGLSGGKEGSPILYYGESVKEKLQIALGDDFDVKLAMRYQNPSMDDVLAKMYEKDLEKIIIVPLFPQYASATTGSIIEKAMKIIGKWWIIPEIKFINQFYENENYINTAIEQVKKYNLDEYDHILFSYHGLPIRQVDKVYKDGTLCEEHSCETEINETNQYCYKATCYATTRLISEKLKLKSENYTVCFQSRLDKKWLEPFADKVLIEQAKKGAKKLLVFSPAFVADCLETIVEIGTEYQQLFENHGGEKVQLVESLNDHPMWIDALKEIILSNS
ncbi:MAG: ferrochelatase [Ignavibacteria bacterium]|nr:ferrochelatase [Ignavibacteria bacterium]MBT8381478.1 ferrochelatase [Ignavibacteria bacterium]MBT8391540.1 ferrochelatase [Ignavibacteria bacterium]NNJ52232.1 ferrochelatase [Ignavibacteriaceae bacterium]NNL22709.1 ferrochelatase [Ignavibacteriaceae bacterium]